MVVSHEPRSSSEISDSWLRSHANRAAMSITLLGLLVRVWTASGTFLNPDEALHFRLANHASLAVAYRQSLTASHPPLLTSVLYLWRAFGTSELWLRFPSVLAGAAFCWMFYKWLAATAGNLAGFIGLLFVAFLPPIVLLSAEVRQYALLLAFLASALYFFDGAFTKKSPARMAAFSLFLYLAMLSHYSALLFAAALGIYALLRFITARFPLSLMTVWAGGQLGALALATFLYESHISKLGAGESRTALQGWMSEFFLRHSYFDSARDNPLFFLVGHTFGVFQYFFGQLAVGDAMGLLFFVGVATLPRRGLMKDQPCSRGLGILLLLPFAIAGGASLAHFYPYGGTRHIAFLIIPAIAGVTVAIAYLARHRWDRAVVLGALIVVVCIVFGKARQPYMQRADQDRTHMNAAIDFLRQNVAGEGVIFTDYESDLILGHYLCRQRPIRFETSIPEFEVFSCDGVRVISASYKAATLFDANSFLSSWNRLVETYHLKAGDSVWVFQAGWKADLSENLQNHYAVFDKLRVESFGSNIKLFKLTVGHPMPAIVSQAENHFPAW
ncbi:MAG TPA: glycosyltransferase family 39 protein [Candidatus Polarisedimenticolia bacterium]|nr:glycosyltransferase family 39 protein [Candidatus Polarisedimenticolia bacterium]